MVALAYLTFLCRIAQAEAVKVLTGRNMYCFRSPLTIIFHQFLPTRHSLIAACSPSTIFELRDDEAQRPMYIKGFARPSVRVKPEL
jgi:hypothetical protein